MVNNIIDINNLEIPKDEVLRYLGYKKQNIDKALDNLIDLTIEESKELLIPKYIYGRYQKVNDNYGVRLKETNLILKGNDIKEHLKLSDDVILMAATVGSKIEKKISLYEKVNLTKALILDSCATTAVEEMCDKIENHIRIEALKINKGITFRYSPGYGDLPLDVQNNLLSILKADKTIGVTASEHYLLFPRKSVTAIIGLIPKESEDSRRGCEVCKNYETCNFRREGLKCGN